MANEPTSTILALDLDEREQAFQLLEHLGTSIRWVKIGLRLFTRYGPEIIEECAHQGYAIFLDLKLHDIPRTVATAVESLAAYPIDMLTLHACGGAEMLRQACAARGRYAPSLKLLGATVLTSMDTADLASIGIRDTAQQQSLRLARLAIQSGCDGLVCSAQELSCLRKELGPASILVTPGIRPAQADTREQKRIATPAEAMRRGATYIVVGRPILEAEDPLLATQKILEQVRTKGAKKRKELYDES